MTNREYAKNLFSAWSDDDWLHQPIFDKLLFQVLNGQRAVNTAGIQPINFTRWRKAMRDDDVIPPVLELKAALLRMERRGYVFTDEDTGEVLIRSRIRNDGLDKQPTMFLSALRILAVIDSPKFAAVMDHELERMVCPDVKGETDQAKRLRTALNKASTEARAHLKTLSGGYEEPYLEPFGEDFQEPYPEGYAGPYPPPGEIEPSPEGSLGGSLVPIVSGSVSVSSSPPIDGYVGRTRARATESGLAAADPLPDDPPPPTCLRHRNIENPPPCGPCGSAREARKAFDAEIAQRGVRARAAFWAEVRDCPDCDQHGLIDRGNRAERCPAHDWGLINVHA